MNTIVKYPSKEYGGFEERYDKWGTFHNTMLMEDFEVVKWVLSKDPTMIEMWNGTSEDLLECFPMIHEWFKESRLYPKYFETF